MKTIILDLDGCIADDRHRQHLIKGNSWETYHQECHKDKLINAGCIELCRALEIIPTIVTGRPRSVRSQTMTWLWDVAGLPEYVLLMRSDGDTSSAPDLKRKLITGISSPNVICAFDDRPDVLGMYREYNIPTIRVGYEWRFPYPQPPPPQAVGNTPSIPELLRAGAKTFEERNAVYGETYLAFGQVMDAMFAAGLKIEPGDVDAYNRLGIFVQNVTKLCRYATSLPLAGHVDSAHDNMVYSAMLEYLTRKSNHKTS